MAAFFVRAGIVGVMLSVVMQGRLLSRKLGRQGNSSFGYKHVRGYPAPTDVRTFCTDTFDDYEHLFRSDKSLFCCCTSGSLTGIILP